MNTVGQNMNSASANLARVMQYCYGTENYYTGLGLPFKYTDGVKTFCDTALAYWILDIVASVVKTDSRMGLDLISITLLVNENNTASISFKDSKETFYTQQIPYTDCPCGEWQFYYEYNVLFWKGEY